MSTGSQSDVKESQASSGGYRLPSILIVDDSLDMANSLRVLLKKNGYETDVAYHWEAALEIARSHLPDIILLDLGMPEIDGVHLARFLREDEKLKDKVLIAITGYADEMHQQQCKTAGFDAFLSKPVPWSVLKSTLDSVWSKRLAPPKSN